MIELNRRNAWAVGLAACGVALLKASPPAKITGGLAYMGLGGYMLKASKIWTATRQHFFGVRPRETPVALDKDRLYAAGTSLFSVAGGLFLTILGLAQAAREKERREILGLMARAFDCQESHDLLDELKEQDLSFSVQFKMAAEIPGGEMSVLNPTTRLMGIRRDLDGDERFGQFLSQLCRLKSIKPLTELALNATTGAIKFGRYVLEHLSQDFLHVNCAHNVAKGCIKRMGWDPKIDYFSYLFVGPDPAWADFGRLVQQHMSEGDKNLHVQALLAEWNKMQEALANGTI